MVDHNMPHKGRTRLVEISRLLYDVRSPFNPRTTLQKPSHFPCPFEYAKPGEYVFITRVGRQQIGCRATYTESAQRVDLQLYAPETSPSSLNLGLIKEELARRLGLTLELDDFEQVWQNDSLLSRLPKEMLGARPSSPFSFYEFLVICTVLQNTTVRRTVQMTDAVVNSLGTAYQFPDGSILHGFWEPLDLVEFGEKRLRELKLGYRAKNLVRFSEQFCAHPEMEAELLEFRSDIDQLRFKVREIYGVGPASAGYIMFEWFKCVDELNHISPWERKILDKLIFDRADTPANEIVQFCRNRWAPHTMLAVHAIFEAIFWRRVDGQGPEWLDELIRL